MAWSGRREDHNALSSLELAKRHVGKQLCHQTCETDLLLWLFITHAEGHGKQIELPTARSWVRFPGN